MKSWWKWEPYRKIVAWSRWHFPRPLTEEERKKPDEDYFPSIPENKNKDLVQEWFNLTFEVEQKYMDREQGYCKPTIRRFPFSSSMIIIDNSH